MKRIAICLLLSATVAPVTLMAQPKMLKNATIQTTTNIIAPEDEEPPIQNLQGGGGGGMNFRNFGDGETKSTTYLKDQKMKTVLKSEMGKSIIFRDNEAKLTTTLVEMMGNKMGFYATDDEQAAMMKQMDSMRQARRKADTTRTQPPPQASDNPVEIINTTETKKIAGYQCIKAWMVTTRLLGIKDTVTIWYTPEFTLQNLTSTGGMSGFGNMINPNAKGFSQVNGFVMGYEMAMRRNRKMEVYVTKIDTEKEIADKEFDIPKDYDLKPMKEMQSMFGGQGGMQFRRTQ